MHIYTHVSHFLLFLLPFTFTASAFPIAKDDEIALLKLKKQLGDPDTLRSWVKGYNFCGDDGSNVTGSPSDFVYIECYNRTTGRVSTLSMQLDVVAPFPNAICDLTELSFFGIYQSPGIYGFIPSCISKLSNLENFGTVNTSISGPVPNFYNNTKITTINLAQNHLYGTIPQSLSTLTNLGLLNLSSNHLTGTVPPGLLLVYSLQSLSSPMLLLANNKLTGELPKCYRQVDFWRFDVRNNQLSGDASFLFGKQKRAGSILLAKNNFEFDLSYIEFSDSLSELDLSHNKIFGKVPDSLATAGRLWQSEPDLSFNRLCGELPQGGNMWRFNAEDFANNKCLCGNPLPPC